MKNCPVVFVSSPFFSTSGAVRQENVRNAAALCRYAFQEGYEPRAPHLYFPRFLYDEHEQELSIGKGWALPWLQSADELWYCGSLRVSPGMEAEIVEASRRGLPLYRVEWTGSSSRRGRLPWSEGITVGDVEDGTPVGPRWMRSARRTAVRLASSGSSGESFGDRLIAVDVALSDGGR